MRNTYRVFYEGEVVFVDEKEQRVEVWRELVKDLEEDLSFNVRTLQQNRDKINKLLIKKKCEANALRSVLCDMQKIYFPEVPQDEINNLYLKYYADEEIIDGARFIDCFDL